MSDTGKGYCCLWLPALADLHIGQAEGTDSTSVQYTEGCSIDRVSTLMTTCVFDL